MAGADPANIKVSRSRGLTIEWRDGLRSEYGLQYLRDRCPCATCTGGHGGGTPEKENPLKLYRAALKIEGVQPVGNYALQIRWNDGHDTGIYTWEYLRSISPQKPE